MGSFDSITVSTAYTLPFDQLSERFPLTAERFRLSKYWKPGKEEDVVADLITFLGKRDFVIHSTMVFEDDASATDDPIGYDITLKIKSHPVDIGSRWYTDLAEARLHALDIVLEIFEEEMKNVA